MGEITLNRLPKTLQELQAMPQAGLTNPEEDFSGYSPENNYTRGQPHRVTVSENAYRKSQIGERL